MNLQFLEAVSRDIPGPLQLTFMQVRGLTETASDLPYLTLQSIHLTRALQHLVIAVADTISSYSSITTENLEEFLELQR
jgi:hypothetical protein